MQNVGQIGFQRGTKPVCIDKENQGNGSDNENSDTDSNPQ
jgi:hypothetical protein